MKLFRDMRIKTQLLLAFLFVTLISLFVLLIALFNINHVASVSDGLYNKVVLPLDYVAQSSKLMENVKTEGRNTFLIKDAKTREETTQSIIDDITQVKEYMTVFGKTIMKEEAWTPYNDLMRSLDEYINLMSGFRELLSEDLTQEASREKAIRYLEDNLSPVSARCLEDLAILNTIRLELGQELITSAMENTENAYRSMIGFALAGLLIAVSLGVYFSNFLSKPLMQGVTVMAKAAEGDFTVVLPRDYGAEIGWLYDAFNALVSYNRLNLSTIMETSATMRISAQDMLSISAQMADNSKGLNEQTSLVSATVEEFSAGMLQSSSALSTASSHISAVASSIEEINSTLGTVAAAAEQTSIRVEQSNVLVDSIKNSIATSSGSVTLVSDAFNSVAKSVDEINRSIFVINEHCAAAMLRVSDADSKTRDTDGIIRRLEAASKQIGKIVGVISDIADQTNMLALNAAIEAAGAGEAGKGFMVVANEVKELARQTADATDEIAEQIENMQKYMPEAVSAVSEITEIINGLSAFMKSLNQEVTQQGKRSDQIAEESAAAARRMNEITTEIGRISENALSVTKTVVESSKGVNEIAKSTADLVLGTQEIAMNSERASNNISEIDRATKEMTAGLMEISKNIQLIHTEAGAVQQSADQTNHSSGELLSAASGMEEFVSKFKISE